MFLIGMLSGVAATFFLVHIINVILRSREQPSWHEKWEAKQDGYMSQMVATWSDLSKFIKAGAAHHTTSTSPPCENAFHNQAHRPGSQ